MGSGTHTVDGTKLVLGFILLMKHNGFWDTYCNAVVLVGSSCVALLSELSHFELRRSCSVTAGNIYCRSSTFWLITVGSRIEYCC